MTNHQLSLITVPSQKVSEQPFLWLVYMTKLFKLLPLQSSNLAPFKTGQSVTFPQHAAPYLLLFPLLPGSAALR